MPRAITLVDESFRAQTPCIKSHITTEFLHRLGVPRTCQKCFFLPFELSTWLWDLWFYWRHSLLEEPRGGQVTRCLSANTRNIRIWFPQPKWPSLLHDIYSFRTSTNQLIYTLTAKHRYLAMKWQSWSLNTAYVPDSKAHLSPSLPQITVNM